MKLPPNLTEEEVIAAVEEDDNIGFCLACGAQHGGVEPDARNYDCENCGSPRVFGADEILLGLL